MTVSELQGKTAVALIVAHGQPSDPEPAEAELAAFAVRVAAQLPGWSVLSATLADEASLRQAAGRCRSQAAIVYPLFMADGWFTQTHLPQRLTLAGLEHFQQVAPMGLDPGIRDLCVTLVAEALAEGPAPPASADVLLAAHGSSRSPAPALVAGEVAAHLSSRLDNRRVTAAFIDQSPQIAEVAATMGPGALCLPFFAANGGHVTGDLPKALASAGFRGRLLPPVGVDARVPGLVARSLRAAAASLR